MNRYQNIVGRINYGLFLAVAFLLPFPQLPIRYACVAWAVGWFLEGRWLKRPMPIRQNKTSIPFILFGLWFVWQAISFFWSSDRAAWSGLMERYLTFLLIVPVGLWGVNTHYDWRQIGKVLVLGCVTAIPFYLLLMAALFNHPQWGQSIHLAEAFMTYDDWWTFFAENISFLKHRLFLCSVELFGVVMAVQLWHKQKWPLLMTLPIMLSIIPLTASRQAVLTVMAMAAVGIICMLPHMYRWWVGTGVLLLALFIGGGMLMLHPRMQQFELNDITQMREVSTDHESRLNIWALALDSPKDYRTHGLGAGQSTNYLVKKYKEKGFCCYASKRYNAHNQYLEQLMELGLPGLLFFILMWLSVPICTSGKGRRTAWLFFTLYVFNMFTECMFCRFCGVALWIVGLVFILLQSNPQHNE